MKTPTIALAAMLAIACASGPSTKQRDGAGPLPPPTGRYRIATRLLPPFVDTSRPDERFARGARTLLVQLWYPTASHTGERALYFPDPLLLAAIKAQSSAPAVVESWRSLRTHAIEGGVPAPGRFPLILFSPGFGMARSFYTTWVEQLASDGWIVAVVDHPFAGETRIDGRLLDGTPHPLGPHGQTADMAADLRFLLPALVKERGVDASRLAAVGHSIGGAAALEACRLEVALRGCVNLDGDPSFGAFAELGVGKPFLVIHQKPVFPGARPDGELAKMGREIEAAWQRVIGLQSQPVLRLSVRGTGHLSFSDFPFVRPSKVTEGGGVLTDPLLVLHATTAVIEGYLESVFAGHPGAALKTPDFIRPAHLGDVT